MAKPKEPVNPFYVMLAVLGVVFFLTAAAYWQMTVRAIDRIDRAAQPPHPLMTFMETNGMQLMSGELVLLGIATCGAMWLDQYRSGRAERPGRAATPDGKNGSEPAGKIE